MALKSIKGKLETKFSWTHNELQLLIQLALESKSKCKFERDSLESKRSKHEQIYDILEKQYPDDKEKYPNRYFTGKDRVAIKHCLDVFLYNLRPTL